MRSFYGFLFVTFLVFCGAPVFGQVSDTLVLTGTMADTLVGDKYRKEALVYFQKKQFTEAFKYLDIAGQIYLNVNGEESARYGSVLHGKGLVYRNMNKLDSAILFYEKAILVRRKALGAYNEALANSYNNAGNAYRAKGDDDKALDRHQKALEIRLHLFGENNEDVTSSYYSIGLVYFDKEEYEKALESHKMALAIRIRLPKKNLVDIANSYNDIGGTLSAMGRKEEAMASMGKALANRIELYGFEHSEVASMYNNMGEVSFSSGDFIEGLNLFKRALELRIKVFGEKDLKVAESYENVGIACRKMGLYQDALINYQKSTAILRDNFGPDHPKIAESLTQMGLIYLSLYENDKSIDFDLAALQILKNLYGDNNVKVAGIYNNLGGAYLSKGDYDKAEVYFLKDLRIGLELLGENNKDVGTTYNNLGILSRNKKKYEQALGFYQKALDIRSTQLGPTALDVAETYTNLANLYDDLGNYNKSIEFHEKSLAMLRNTLGDIHPSVAKSYNNLANNYLDKKDFEKAIKMCQKALLSANYTKPDDFIKANDMRELNKAHFLLSKTSLAQYSANEQVSYLEQSLDLAEQTLKGIEYQMQSFSTDGDKARQLELDWDSYEMPLKIYGKSKPLTVSARLTERVFSCFEKSKSALLKAQIRETNIFHFANLPDSLLQQEYFLRFEITRREKEQQTLINTGLTEIDSNVLKINAILFNLRGKYTDLKERLKISSAEYYRLKYDLSTVSLAYVQDTLLTKKQTLLEYFVGDSSLYLFVVKPDTFVVRELKRDFPLEDWIEQFRHGLYGYYSLPDAQQTEALKTQCRAQYLEFAPKLYQKLFAPIEGLLTEKEAVIIVPDGPLGYIPFDALLTGAPKKATDYKSYPYLLNKYQFSYTYSATLLREMRDKKHHHEPLKEFAAFAPFYTGDTLIMMDPGSITSTRQGFKPLPYSNVEVNGLHKMMGGDVVTGAYATEQRFVDIAGDYRILHLATHGVADNRVGDYAYLAFSEINDSIENEMLYVKDLYNLELNADLVVLSACETGVGKLQRGEGIISLARAFAYAGAKSIITSLWSVSDQSTSELMTLFYKELKTGKTKDKALHDARLEYLKAAGVKNSHPFFWAAFVPVGDMRATAGGRR